MLSIEKLLEKRQATDLPFDLPIVGISVERTSDLGNLTPDCGGCNPDE